VSKVLVLLSGGIDSTTLLAHCRKGFDRVGTLSIDYGQAHRRELESAQLIAEYYQVPHKVLTLPKGLFARSALTGGDPAPSSPYTVESIKQTVVPGRNLVFIALAGAVAEREGYSDVAIAAHSGDHAIYPDCRPEFLEAARQALSLGTNGKISLYTPFSQISKREIIQSGVSLGVLYHLTYSCYRGGERHCGVCSTCRERKEAFRTAGVPDPTPYEFDEEDYCD